MLKAENRNAASVVKLRPPTCRGGAASTPVKAGKTKSNHFIKMLKG
jgi:hypothetical protein